MSMEGRVQRRPVWQPPRHARLLSFIRVGLRQVSFPRLLIAALVLPLLAYIYREITRDTLVIDPFTVPKRFEESGLTSEVVSNRIGDALRKIETTTETRMRKDNLTSLHDEGSTPDVEIPGTKLGLKTVVDITRAIFEIYPKHVSGDIVFVPPASSQATIRVYITQGRKRNRALSLELAADNIELLAQSTAEKILEDINPYVLASYQYDHHEYGKTVDLLRPLVEDRDHDLVDAAFDLWGLALLDQRKYEEAAVKDKEAIDFDPKNAIAYNNWGLALYHQKKYAAAITKYQKAIDLGAKHAYIYNNWGNVLADQKKYGDAVAMYQKAIDLDEKDKIYVPVRYSWGVMLYNQKKYADAIARYQEVIHLDPKYTLAYSSWGNVLRDLKKYDDAIAKYQEAILLDPKSTFAYNGWGNVLRDLKRYDDAIAKYQTAIDLDPEDAVAYNSLGNVLRDLKKYDDAIARCQKATDLNPRYASAYTTWGNVLYEQKQYDKAIAKYQKAIDLDPEDPLAYTGWALALRAQGKYDEAKRQFDKAASQH